MTLIPIKLNSRYVKPHKATRSPEFGSQTVLTNNPWEYVALWLQRSNLTDASFYWSQARAFSNASRSLPLESAPLLHYYTFMNATKALLVSKGVPLVGAHGVGKHNMLAASTAVNLDNEGVRIKNKGVLPGLSTYFGEPEPMRDHSMRDLLFNIPCIHRTFCITYLGQEEMFIPLMACRYVFDSITSEAYFAATLSEHVDASKYMAKLPTALIANPLESPRALRSAMTVKVSGPNLVAPADVHAIMQLNNQLRADIHYIAGAETLWYAKMNSGGIPRIQRSPLTLMLAAMHRLSELSRYHPMELSKFFSGPQNWLLSEFVSMSPPQFLDEITAEITGHQCMAPNVRPAN